MEIFCELCRSLKGARKNHSNEQNATCITCYHPIKDLLLYYHVAGFVVFQLADFEIHSASSENCTNHVRLVQMTRTKYESAEKF